jgi:hypothetical protein
MGQNHDTSFKEGQDELSLSNSSNYFEEKEL